MGDVVGGRMRMLRSIAESLVEQVADEISAHDRLQLGIECQTDADYDAAQHHFTEAVALATTEDPGDRVIALRHLGAIYYVPTNPGFNPALGALAYEQAIASTAGNEDPFGGKFYTGFTYQSWARALAASGSPDWEEKAALARQTYASMPDDHQYRDTYIGRLDEWVRQMHGGVQSPPELPELPPEPPPSVR